MLCTYMHSNNKCSFNTCSNRSLQKWPNNFGQAHSNASDEGEKKGHATRAQRRHVHTLLFNMPTSNTAARSNSLFPVVAACGLHACFRFVLLILVRPSHSRSSLLFHLPPLLFLSIFHVFTCQIMNFDWALSQKFACANVRQVCLMSICSMTRMW